VIISEKFLIIVQKYLKVINQKQLRDRKAIKNQTFFTEDPDEDIDMGSSDKEEDDE
jgi:hypothetical protein